MQRNKRDSSRAKKKDEPGGNKSVSCNLENDVARPWSIGEVGEEA